MEAKDLLDNLLEQNYEDRYTALKALRHPWITGHCAPPDIEDMEEGQEDDEAEDKQFQERLREAMNQRVESAAAEEQRVDPFHVQLRETGDRTETQSQLTKVIGERGAEWGFKRSGRKVEMDRVRAKILLVHKKQAQMFLKNLFQMMDEDNDSYVTRQDL